MTHIYLEHNPFTVDTIFKIDGVEPDIKAFSNVKNLRLQEWIETLFTELNEHFNGLPQVSIEFKGVENDYLDLVAVAEEAREKQGMEIDLTHIPAENANNRLNNIQNLVKEAESHRLFKTQMPNYKKEIEASFDKDFDIYVVATMSAGKSTLINAMLGYDLLPAANEATTATIAKIYDTDLPVGEYQGQRLDFEGNVLDPVQALEPNTLAEWNKKEDTGVIEIKGNISGIVKRDNVRLVLSDTPGPNNSQTDAHELTTKTHIQDSQRNPMILYVLNGTQLGINDDKYTLNTISEIMEKGGKRSKDRFLFVVNKMDNLDTAKESVANTLDNVKKYLKGNGIDNPIVYPISANLTRLLRKRKLFEQNIGPKLTDGEEDALYIGERKFNRELSMDLTQYMNLTNIVKEKLRASNYSQPEYRSGLPAVEKVIDTYIEKYNLPERVTRAYQALNSAIEACTNEAELVKGLEVSEQELVKIEGAIKQLKSIQADSANTEQYIKELREKGIGLPKEIISETTQIEKGVTSALRKYSGYFSGEVGPSQAKNLLSNLSKDIHDYSLDLQAKFKLIFERVDELTGKELGEEYNRRLKAIFDNVSDFKLPQLEHVREQIQHSFNLQLRSNEIDEREVFSHTETYTVRKNVKVDERWIINPVRWFKGKDIYEERDVTEKKDVYKTVEYVDLSKIWEERGDKLKMEFDKFTKQATEDILAHHQKLVEIYINFIEKEFTPKFNQILEELEDKIKNRATLQEKIELAKADLAEIAKFKQKLEEVISL